MLAANAHPCIDHGTSTTTALVSTPDGRCLPIVINGSALLSSGVRRDPATGRLLTGAPAAQAARDRPETWLAEPLRHLGADSVAPAGTGPDPVEAVAAVLGGITTHAALLAGTSIGVLTLGCSVRGRVAASCYDRPQTRPACPNPG